jgi:predicted Zn-dependent protease
VTVALLTCVSGCWYGYPRHTQLHYVDGELVETPAPAPAAYEAYLRARIALDRTPPQVDEARTQILEALGWQPNEPKLWTVKAEVEWAAGNFGEAEADLGRALELRPDYPEAKQMLVQVKARDSRSAALTSD